MTAALRLEGVTKAYGDEVVLHDVSLHVDAGEIHSLVGLNGAGKTTLMRLLLGITRATSGLVTVRGKDVSRMSARDWQGTGHLIETPLAYPELTVRENLWLAGRLAGLSSKQAVAGARELADELLLGHWWDKRARTLSLGNRQRIGLAAALISRPTVLVLDEPTNALDPAGVVLVREALLRRVAQHGTAVLVSSHHLDEVARMSDRISVINGGRMIGTLDPTQPDIERGFFDQVYADVQVSA